MSVSKAQRAREESARQSGFFAPEEVKKTNPCVRLFGEGPEGRKCKECALLTAHAFQRTFYKCSLRVPGGPATDHRVNWPACAKFEARTFPAAAKNDGA